jgi:phosphate transport system protein
MPSEHIVKSYGRELERYKARLLNMADEAGRQLEKTLVALAKRDSRLAREVIDKDADVNFQQTGIDAEAARLLALRQPMAKDFREVIAGLKIAAELERVADYARNVARHLLNVRGDSLDAPIAALGEMGKVGLAMLREVRGAYETGDIDRADAVWGRDDEIDAQYAELVAQLRDLLASDSSRVEDGTSLLFMSRCMERIGDHIVNIAENVYYIGTGEPYPPCK